MQQFEVLVSDVIQPEEKETRTDSDNTLLLYYIDHHHEIRRFDPLGKVTSSFDLSSIEVQFGRKEKLSDSSYG